MSYKQIYGLMALAFFIQWNVFAHNGEKHLKSKTIISTISKDKFEEINQSYLSKVKPIFNSKCLDCHGNLEKTPWYYELPGVQQLMDHDMEEAKEHMNMTNGFPFTGHGTPREDLESLKEVIDDDSMPPWQYKIVHWNSKLTEEEKKIVNQWIDESLTRLNKGEEK